MKIEYIIMIVAIVVYLFGIIFSKKKPNEARIIKYVGLGLLALSVIVKYYLRSRGV